MSALFATDVIASLAFGLDANSLQNPHGEFRQMCIELSHAVGTHLYLPEYEHFVRVAIKYAINNRKSSQQPRRDVIDIFIALQQQSNSKSIAHQRDFLVAQAAFLMLAGFETSSSPITFALYELSKQPWLQNRLRREIQAAYERCGGSALPYETVQELPYLRMVVDEVLRLYPPTSFLDRCCTSDGYFLAPYSDYRIPKGMPVYISVLTLHRDPEGAYYKPMTYLPFGAGPRGCLGYLLTGQHLP